MSGDADVVVASRSIAFAERKGGLKGVLEIRIMQPFLLPDERFATNGWQGLFGRRVTFDAFPRLDYEAKGADAIQALELAVDIDPVLRRLTDQYDLSFLDGDPYFEA